LPLILRGQYSLVQGVCKRIPLFAGFAVNGSQGYIVDPPFGQAALF
jgi:hypothetical protein